MLWFHEYYVNMNDRRMTKQHDYDRFVALCTHYCNSQRLNSFNSYYIAVYGEPKFHDNSFLIATF